jgi:hypothetical protein
MLGAIVLVASGLVSTLDVGAYNELRLRFAPTVGDTPLTAVDFVTAPYLRVESKSRHLDLKFAYAADVTLPDLEMLSSAPQDPQLFQLADLSAWYSTKHWVFGLSQGGSIGEMNFSYLSPYLVTPGQPVGGPPPVQLIPCADPAHCANETVVFGSSATMATLRYLRDDKTSFGIAPSYNISGGLDAPSRAIVPVLSNPRVDFNVEHRITRRDELLTQGDVTASDESQRACNPATGGPPVNLHDPNPPVCAPSAEWVSLREVWRHRVSRRVATELIGGATVARATVNDTDDPAHANPAQPYRIVPYPVFGGVVTYTLQNPDPDRPALNPVLRDPPKPAAYFYTRVGPVVDTFYGIVDPRLEIGAAIFQPLDAKYLLTARASFVRSLWGTSLDATYVSGEVSAYRRLDKYRFDVGVGTRGAWQQDPFTGEFWVFSAFVAFMWHEPRFVL